MNRTIAIIKAKEAHRLFITRAVKSAGFDLSGIGYVFKAEGWEVYLKDNGSLRSVIAPVKSLIVKGRYNPGNRAIRASIVGCLEALTHD